MKNLKHKLFALFFTFICRAFLYANWIDNQIEEDFAPFTNGIYEESLNSAMELSKTFSDQYHFLVRVKIIDSTPYFFDKEGKRIEVDCLSYFLDKIQKNQPLPDVDFIYFYGGGPEIEGYPQKLAANETEWEDKNKYDYGILPFAPILAGNKTDKLKNIILYHDRMTTVATNAFYNWHNTLQETENAVKNSLWDTKIPKLFWTGQISDFRLKNWENVIWTDYSKRAQLFLMSKDFPDLMDIAITSFWEIKRRNLPTYGIPGNLQKSITHQINYKYQIVLDGYTCSNPGYAWRLLSNCVCLKLDSPKRQWFYKGLQPGVHYIPIKEDFSNLVNTLIYLKNNDKEAKKIAENGRKWAKENLINEDVLIQYCLKVLNKYASLQKFQPKLSKQERIEAFPKPEKLLSFNPHHFFSNDNATALSFLIKAYNCKKVVELGSWMGGSTRHIAINLPEDGIVYAIDHWLGNKEHNRRDMQPLLPTLYNQFLSNCIHAKLTHKIIPKKMTTLDASKTLNIKADLIFVDAGHDETDVYKDLVAWYPHLQKNGIMCGDDWFWNKTPDKSYPIQNAVKRFAKEKGLFIEQYGDTFWLLKNSKQIILNIEKVGKTI